MSDDIISCDRDTALDALWAIWEEADSIYDVDLINGEYRGNIDGPLMTLIERGKQVVQIARGK